ncbi:cupin domain-containing protein [Fimbriiglobus ruber]|uniref:cupin domain-containing protein n=1 Tax=Fimbriiglobus ruber TaxID=1908690 RepID=UPI000B4AB007|nr:cupin domain-containing protein [Fimbriiglobus ruber]
MSDDVGPSAEELAALYLAGALPDDERKAFEARLAAGWPEAAAALREFENAVRALVAEGEPAEPAPELKGAILARLSPPESSDESPGITFRFFDALAFQPTRYPGMSIRVLHVDQPRNQFTCLIRLEPGAVYPGHPHDGPEECVVLEGEVFVGAVLMRRGDYQRADVGSEHREQRTERGATLFVTAPLSQLYG